MNWYEKCIWGRILNYERRVSKKEKEESIMTVYRSQNTEDKNWKNEMIIRSLERHDSEVGSQFIDSSNYQINYSIDKKNNMR